MLGAVAEQIPVAVDQRGVADDKLTLDTDYTPRSLRARLADQRIARRRGYRDPESQATIESWF